MRLLRMLWLTAAIIAALSVASALAAQAPILAGPWGMGQKGYGHVKPHTIFNGGDPTGLVEHIDWLSWGGTRAVGAGIAEYVGPHQSVAEGTQQIAKVVLFQLGRCHGRRAYDAIEWYFPQHGQRFNPHLYINACTGTYYPLP
jgi:hypothetical protein